MSSGGGGGNSHTAGIPLSELLKQREDREKNEKYEREVNEYIQSLFEDINSRDTEQINKHLQNLKSALDSEIEGVVDLKFGGSLQKHTYANGLSDIDMLVQINNSSFDNKSPKEVLSLFAQQLKKRLPNTYIEVGKLAVTVKYSTGYEIQLLPSIKTNTGYKIASTINEDKWSNVIKPHKFAQKLTNVNKESGGKVVPLIKLFKKINNTLPRSSQLSGYHIESLAIDAFKNPPQSLRTYKGMIEHFVSHSQRAVLAPIKDSTGQSVHVDGYLGGNNSTERRRVSQSLKMIEKRINAANTSKSIDSWEGILGE